MFKKTNLWRGMSFVCALFLTISVMAANILEIYRTSVDAFVGTRSQKTVTEESADGCMDLSVQIQDSKRGL
jgi:beta-glucosidase